jgi:predicted porin
MKKTLAAVAVLGAFAGSALAADVQLYGIVDTGLRYTHFDADSAAAGYDATDSFGIQSGNQSGSRFGFKGTEDLGNGLTVGFILENQFNSDDGSLADEDHFFRRESSLFLQGGFGKVAMGRMGSINGGTSSWAKYGVLSAFGTSWDYSAQAGSWAIGGGMWDNMIAYETPDFAGFKVFAQYGMGTNDAENESRSDRYYAIGASYANGPLNLYFAVDSINYQTADANGALANASDIDDSLTITFGGNYDFEVLKLFAGAQYFDEIKLSKMGCGLGMMDVTEFNSSYRTGSGTDADPYVDHNGFASAFKGWSLGVSASIPAAGGQVLVGAAYLDAEAADSVGKDNDKDELSRWIVSAGYDYPLSKRTNVYGVVTYAQDSLEYTESSYKDQDPTIFAAMVGIRHKF